MRFMCLVYFDETSFAGFTEEDGRRLTDATIEEDNDLRRRGKLILAQPLDEPATAVNVRVRNGKVLRTDGPYAETKEWLGGFTLIAAKDMDEAIALTAESEITKISRIEIRPILVQTHSVTGTGRPELQDG
ncbi:MAG TPA: YciI family protein [Devosia sp.]|nr:YciI family protein [Devosia sp.]